VQREVGGRNDVLQSLNRAEGFREGEREGTTQTRSFPKSLQMREPTTHWTGERVEGPWCGGSVTDIPIRQSMKKRGYQKVKDKTVGQTGLRKP